MHTHSRFLNRKCVNPLDTVLVKLLQIYQLLLYGVKWLSHDHGYLTSTDEPNGSEIIQKSLFYWDNYCHIFHPLLFWLHYMFNICWLKIIGKVASAHFTSLKKLNFVCNFAIIFYHAMLYIRKIRYINSLI